MDKLSGKAVTADMFIATVHKYTRAKALTPRMLNELIDRIEVHQAEKVDGEWIQRFTIHYNPNSTQNYPYKPAGKAPGAHRSPAGFWLAGQ